jgi:hypothetical protein
VGEVAAAARPAAPGGGRGALLSTSDAESRVTIVDASKLTKPAPLREPMSRSLARLRSFISARDAYSRSRASRVRARAAFSARSASSSRAWSATTARMSPCSRWSVA